MHAQALTLAVLSGAAAYHYYEINRDDVHHHQITVEDNSAPNVTNLVEWELHNNSPF
jgi:hypothetical protein